MDSPSLFSESELADLTGAEEPIAQDLLPITTGLPSAQTDSESKDAVAEAIADEQNVFGDYFEDTSTSSRASTLPALHSPSSAARKHHSVLTVSLPVSTLVNPRSCFEGFVPPVPLTKERHAVKALLELDTAQLSEDFVEFELDNFCVYVDVPGHPLELRAPHHHATKTGEALLFFDGILRLGSAQFWVQKVPFDEVPLGNYGISHPTVGDQIWIRSKLNQSGEIYYQLKRSAVEYRRFHAPFLWVADFAKHFVDYCESMLEKHRKVSIHNFKADFSAWLFKHHKQSPEFRAWHSQRGSNDFRSSVVANKNFLYKEACGVLAGKARFLQVFREVGCTFYKPTGRLSSDSDEEGSTKDGPGSVAPTIVTPYIYDCFSHMQVGPYLKRVEPQISSAEATRLSWPEVTNDWSFTRRPKKGVSRETMITSIRVGDMISTPPDGAHTGTKWKSVGGPDPRWYGLVQKVHVYKDASRSFDVTWLYRPIDTPCCSMKYPWANELFLSDHCTCNEGKNARIHDNEVLNTHSVEWLGTPNTTAEFFIRRLYKVELRRFVTLQRSNLRCDHTRDSARPVYRVGDTVLIATDPSQPDVLEPCEIVELNGNSQHTGDARLRKFVRRRDVDPEGLSRPPNELVYTNEFIRSKISKIWGRCIIRIFSPNDVIPTPYDRNGTGNAFFMTHRRDINDGSVQYSPLKEKPTLRQGFDPKRRVKHLQALDLFCGCGNFGRGLEESGALKVRWANDIWSVAISTYMANAPSQTSVSPFLGSVDDLLHRGLEGFFSESVPRPGEVDFVSGGSPCPGFSNLTSDKTTAKQQKNRSLIASFASFIDFYRPKYGVLENVTTIVPKQRPGMGPIEDFFSQLICAIVGMGYQTRIILGDAWTHGAPQSRPRAFLYFAAPGLRLPEAPQLSHSHPAHMSLHGLGRMSNGEPYVQREIVPTPFSFVSAGEATADLPDIGDSVVNTCIPFPDHRLSISISTGNTRVSTKGSGTTSKNLRAQILNIPTRPYGMDFSKTWKDGHGVMTGSERETFPDEGQRVSNIAKSWGRHPPSMLFPTITTACSFTDARIGGHLLHWDQPRPLTIMEVRRAQGIPDDEVLLGIINEQWKMVGNSVARQMALALGLAFREAWLGSLYEDDGEAVAADAEIEALAENDVALLNGAGRTAALSVDELAADDDTAFLDFQPSSAPDHRVRLLNELDSTSASRTSERTSLESFLGGKSSTATSVPINDTPVTSSGTIRKRRLSDMLAKGSLSGKKMRPIEARLEESDDEAEDDEIASPANRKGPTIVRLPSYNSDEDGF